MSLLRSAGRHNIPVLAQPIFVTLSELASVAEYKKDPLCSTSGWRPAGKPTFEVRNLQRTLKSSTVPMPKTLLRMILNATLPRLIQRALLAALPQELGQYLLACRQGIHIAGACRSHTVPFFSLANCDSMAPKAQDSRVACCSSWPLLHSYISWQLGQRIGLSAFTMC